MSLIIERLNGETYKTNEIGIRVQNFTVDSPSPKTEIEQIEGMDGHIDLGTTYEGRTLRMRCLLFAIDRYDGPLLRNKVFQIFNSKESFYLIDDYEPGKRWIVKYNSPFTITPKIVGEFEIEFLSPSSYAESIGTTLDPKTFDEDVWQVGQGLILDETDYTHGTTTFSIYNAGDEAINPGRYPFIITYTGASTNLKILNQTTGDEWQYTGSSVAGDSITLDGVQSKKNGASIFKNTNRKLITLVPGWNDFTLTGTSGGFTISFDFRFYTI